MTFVIAFLILLVPVCDGLYYTFVTPLVQIVNILLMTSVHCDVHEEYEFANAFIHVDQVHLVQFVHLRLFHSHVMCTDEYADAITGSFTLRVITLHALVALLPH